MVWWSFRQGQLAFEAKAAPTTSAVSPHSIDASFMPQSLPNLQAVPMTRFAIVNSSARSLRSFKEEALRWLSVKSVNFDFVFMAQELVQIASQTYQCYWLSQLVTSKWINAFAVINCFLNCISTPLIRVAVPRDLPRQRLLSVLCDCWLNLIQAVLIPLLIFYPYYKVFDPVNMLREELLYNDVWFPEAVHQFNLILIVSRLDFAMTLLPHLQVFASLQSIQGIVRRAPTEAKKTAVADPMPTTSKPGKSTTKQVNPRSVASTRVAFMRRMTSVALMTTPKMRAVLTSSQLSVLDMLVTLYGVALFVVHQKYQLESAVVNANCRSFLSPWFAHKVGCLVIQVNCFREGIQGSQHEIDRILQEMEPSVASTLILSHCASLEVPESVNRLHNLFIMEIYNSSLSKWDHDAQLRHNDLTSLTYVYFERTNFSEFPRGLLGDEFPQMVHEVMIFESNLSSVPADLHVKWPKVESVVLEFTQISVYADTLTKMPGLAVSSMIGNQIDTIDEDAFVDSTHALEVLHLSANPLKKLPSSLGNLNSLALFTMEYTHVSHIPEFVEQWLLHRVDTDELVVHSAFGTPFCQTQINANGSASGSTSTARTNTQEYFSFACAQDFGSRWGGYPIELIAAQRLP